MEKNRPTKEVIPVTWVDIPDSNADFPAEDCPDGVGFTGEMAKNPTTNAQYTQYLNETLASGNIEVVGNQVKGTTGDYAGQNYYKLDGVGYSGVGATNGGASRIKYSKGIFTVDYGFEDHPVTYMSWYGAMAFADYYGWRLPTEWEWESVANYNDHRTYATGDALCDGEAFFANYRANGDDVTEPNNISYHNCTEHGTTPVGHFGYYGYGLADMSGNVWERTSSLWSPTSNYLVIRGGSWNSGANYCNVSNRYKFIPDIQSHNFGFRVCR